MSPVWAGSNLSDIDVTTQVKTALLRDGTLQQFDITVLTTKGDVRLIGVVDNQAQRDSAIAMGAVSLSKAKTGLTAGCLWAGCAGPRRSQHADLCGAPRRQRAGPFRSDSAYRIHSKDLPAAGGFCRVRALDLGKGFIQ
jgi:hypothetical protein